MDPIRTYFRQSEALEDAEASSCCTFSWETELGGKRKYIVSKLEDFWRNYSQRESRDRKVYEVIPPTTSSKVYMDLEFMKNENPSKDGKELLKVLIEETCLLLKNQFAHQVNQEDVLILEASTASKFSLHVIFTQTAFKDNRSVGDFVKMVLSKLHEKHSSLFMVKKKSQITNFVDISVYKRGQNFRVYLSRKLGKENTLYLSDAAHESWHFKTDEDIFRASLISNVSNQIGVLSHTETSCANLDVPCAPPPMDIKSTRGKYKSPYHEIEDLIVAKVYPGTIRECIFRPNRLLFQISGNRFCDNVQRQHTNNNIYFIVNLEDLTLMQACHSCFGFRGKPVKIDPRLISWIDDTEDGDFENQAG